MEPRTVGRANVVSVAARKPMTSQVNWALLGLLLERPGYGYQLMQRFDRAYGDVLSLASESHIYTALNELKRRGFIEEFTGSSAIQSGTERQPKVRYRASVDGARSYREWMFAQAWEDRRQSRLFVRQLAAFESEPEAALEILERYEKACLKEASQLPNAAGGLADRLLSEESRLAMEGRLPWVEYARSEFGALEGGRSDEHA
jgi:DNA-binding PadR family transcriptional regulator